MATTSSYLDALKSDAKELQELAMELLDASTIAVPSSDEHLVRVLPRNQWGETDKRQQVLQVKLLRLFQPWAEAFGFLFCRTPGQIRGRAANFVTFVGDLIERQGSWQLPDTVEEAKNFVTERFQYAADLLELLEEASESPRIIVPDTNALIAEPDVSKYSRLVCQERFTVVFVPAVLAELDQLKVRREDGVSGKAKAAIRRIKGLRVQGCLRRGVTVHKAVTVRMIAAEPDMSATLSWLRPENRDDQILGSVLEVQREYPASQLSIVTGDLNLQNKAVMARLSFLDIEDLVSGGGVT